MEETLAHNAAMETKDRGVLDWSKCDFWRSYYFALAVQNGHDADAAVARHRKWCIDNGLEKGEGNETSTDDQAGIRREA